MNTDRQALLRAIFAEIPRERLDRWREALRKDREKLERVYEEAKKRDE